jgi:KDO2-lipid IV(A) lauroyltransferase
MTQAFTQAIEAAVRRRPDQWMWMHRRWRHQPGRRPRLHRGSRAERRGPAPEAGTEA